MTCCFMHVANDTQIYLWTEYEIALLHSTMSNSAFFFTFELTFDTLYLLLTLFVILYSLNKT